MRERLQMLLCWQCHRKIDCYNFESFQDGDCWISKPDDPCELCGVQQDENHVVLMDPRFEAIIKARHENSLP